jgi:hypothetical protein
MSNEGMYIVRYMCTKSNKFYQFFVDCFTKNLALGLDISGGKNMNNL